MHRLIIPLLFFIVMACNPGPKKGHGAGDYKTRKFKGNPQKSQMDRNKLKKY